MEYISASPIGDSVQIPQSCLAGGGCQRWLMWRTAASMSARERREREKTEQKLITRWWNSKRPPPLYISRIFPTLKRAGHGRLEKKKTPVALKWLSEMKIWGSLNRSSGIVSLYPAWIPTDQRAVCCFYFHIFKNQFSYHHDINVVWREWRLVLSNTMKETKQKKFLSSSSLKCVCSPSEPEPVVLW